MIHKEVIDKLAASTSYPNWDDEKAVPILKEHWNKAYLFLIKLGFQNPDLPDPFICACPDGSIHLNWIGRVQVGEDNHHRRFTIELYQDDSHFCVYENMGGNVVDLFSFSLTPKSLLELADLLKRFLDENS